MSKINLYQGQAPNAATAVYTAGIDTTIDAASVCNPTAGAVDLSVWLAPSGAAAADANKLYDVLSVGAHSQASLSLLINQAIPKTGKLFLLASTATSLTVIIAGRT